MWWNRKADELQFSVRYSEYQSGTDYEGDVVRRSIVHAREDIVLLVSHLSSVNSQLFGIKVLLVLTMGVLSYIAYILS